MPDVSFPFRTDLTREYRYQFRCELVDGEWTYNWELIGEKGGMHLHIHGPHHYSGEDHWSAGLEYHSRAPRHGDNEPPDHDECWLLCAPCWHEGTSLCAREAYLPLFYAGLFGLIFSRLAVEARRYFEETPDAP